MADANSTATPRQPATEVAEHDLTIDIYPRGYVMWVGTSEQLRDEGLIPQDFSWPHAFDWKVWTADGFEFMLWRSRPEGAKGPKRLWAAVDNWSLRRRLESQPLDGWAAARIYEKEQELSLVRWQQTREWSVFISKHFAARADKDFQAFLAKMPGACKTNRRGRRLAQKN